MNLNDFLKVVGHAPLVASVQASPGSPTSDPAILGQLALASVNEGVRLLRMEGRNAIRVSRTTCKMPVIGLIKRTYAGSDVYITPTLDEVQVLLASGCEIIALDATARTRPNGATAR